ncbi:MULTISPECIES: hypothetical protein [Nostocaceae]|nr:MULTISPECIES: hypothetical protein [Nostocaceae]
MSEPDLPLILDVAFLKGKPANLRFMWSVTVIHLSVTLSVDSVF